MKASGLKSLPSAATRVNTGRKEITVVATAVMTALPTSVVARWITSRRGSAGPPARWAASASSRRERMFSTRITPMSTMVPMAMAMPERATMLASTPTRFMTTNTISTASGSTSETSSPPRRLPIIISTTMTVIRICRTRASLRVPRVSSMSPVRS